MAESNGSEGVTPELPAAIPEVPGARLRSGRLFAVVFSVAILLGIVLLFLVPWQSLAGGVGRFRAKAYSRTTLVPTLDSPLPKGKNTAWCGTFQLAWTRLKDDVVRAPIQLEGASALAASLNQSPLPPGELKENSYFAAAGKLTKEFLDQTKAEMARRFPTVTPNLPAPGGGIGAYAYLHAEARFTIPYFDSEHALPFTDAEGKITRVSAFGLDERHEEIHDNLRKQASLLYYTNTPPGEPAKEFILDPCVASEPYQVLLALIPRRESLKEMIDYVQSKELKYGEHLFGHDRLAIPDVRLDLVHHFSELIGQQIQNPGFEYSIGEAQQALRFSLTRTGAELKAEAKISAKAEEPMRPTVFELNKPFLVLMRKRGGHTPFFAMWIETPEVLTR